ALALSPSRRVENVIGGRVGAGRETARGPLAEELGNVKGLVRRIDDVAFLADERAIDPLHDPLQLAAQYDPEFGEVGVHVAAVSWPALGIVALVPINEVPADPVLSLGWLAPGALTAVGGFQVLDIDVDAVSFGILAGHVVWIHSRRERDR